MFRLWCKLFDDSNHLLKDMVVENDDAATNRTRKIFDGIHSACYACLLYTSDAADEL